MKKFISLLLSFFLLLSSVQATTTAFLPSEETEVIYSTIESQTENSPNQSLINFIETICQKSIYEELNFDNLGDNYQEIFADLLLEIANTHFTQDEVSYLSGFLGYYLSHNETSDLFYMFAGAFLSHKDFRYFRDIITLTVSDYNLNEGRNVNKITPYILALKEAYSLEKFANNGEDLIAVLERKIQQLSYLGQKPYNGRGMLLHRSTYLNEYAADRLFLEAYSYFTPKEGDSFLKSFVTTILPVPHSLPSRNLNGEYLNDDDGKAHALAFEMIDILIRHYILNEQDDKVYQFVENNGIRQGPYYFQFSLDALGTANIYYNSLEGENAEARHNLWEERQEALITDFKESSDPTKRRIVLLEKTTQLYLEYYTIGKIFSYTGRFVLSPAAKAVFALLPKNIQIRIVTTVYLTKGYIRQGVKKYLHDTPRHLWRRLVGNGGRYFLVGDPKNVGAMKNFIKGSLRGAGIAEDTEIYQFFKTLTFNADDGVTYNYLRNATKYISREDLEEFFRLYQNIPAKYKGPNSFCRIRVLNNKIVPEIENSVVSHPNQILANLRDMMRQGGRILSAENGAGGNVYSRFRLDNGTVIRFGQHEMSSNKLHIHFEKPITIQGSTYILNKSFLVNTTESLTALASDNVKMLWSLSTQREQEGFLKALFRVAKRDNVQGTRLISDNLKQYIYRLNEYFFGDVAGRPAAANTLMRLTGKTTEKEAIDEALYRILNVCVQRNPNATLHGVYKRELLDKTINLIGTNMSNEDAIKLLQWAMLENTKNPQLIGFGLFSATAVREMTWESYVERP